MGENLRFWNPRVKKTVALPSGEAIIYMDVDAEDEFRKKYKNLILEIHVESRDFYTLRLSGHLELEEVELHPDEENHINYVLDKHSVVSECLDALHWEGDVL